MINNTNDTKLIIRRGLSRLLLVVSVLTMILPGAANADGKNGKNGSGKSQPHETFIIGHVQTHPDKPSSGPGGKQDGGGHGQHH